MAMKNVSFDELTDVQKAALNSAKQAMAHSYNPYSDFFVGATLYNQDGMLISGTNCENAAYGSTLCAKRTAVFRANAMGLRKFNGIAIIARGQDFDTTEVTGPCGSCRQVLYELSQLSGVDLTVILSTTKKDKIVLCTISELLPLAFGPLDLGIDLSRFQK
jgi:cytidine deaminase